MLSKVKCILKNILKYSKLLRRYFIVGTPKIVNSNIVDFLEVIRSTDEHKLGYMSPFELPSETAELYFPKRTHNI